MCNFVVRPAPYVTSRHLFGTYNAAHHSPLAHRPKPILHGLQHWLPRNVVGERKKANSYYLHHLDNHIIQRDSPA